MTNTVAGCDSERAPQIGPHVPNESNPPHDRTAWSGWLVYAALAACPLSKIIAAGLIGGSITATLLNPWFLVLVLVPVIGAAVAVVRRARRRRSDLPA